MPTLTREKVHATMAAIRSKDTKPERIVRRYLWAQGFRYRLNSPRLPGHPDMVLRKYRTCIFVNGCFWHGHEGCKHYTVPKTNTDFWTKKVARNKARDHEVAVKLAKMKWHVITVWECELKGKQRDDTLRSLAFTLNRIWLEDHAVRYAPIEEEENIGIAAEYGPQDDGYIRDRTSEKTETM